MEGFLKDFELEDKDRSIDALSRWRSAVSLVKNPRRRFRNAADLGKRVLLDEKQEKFRTALNVQRAALHFHPTAIADPDNVGVRVDGFDIDPDSIASLVHNYDNNGFKKINGVEGIARKLRVSVAAGVREDSLNTRQLYFGFNRYAEKHAKPFLKFVWESMLDSTLIFLMVCSIVLIGGKFATEGLLVNVYDEVGIILGVFFLVVFTSVNDYHQSLKFCEWDRENKNISVKVTRDGKRQKISIYDLVVGDIVHLSIGDQIPADGICISGSNLHIDESSLTGQVDPVYVNQENPFLLSGTKVIDGSGKMLVAAVGMRTEWGKLVEVLNDVGVEETPLQVKLNGVATIVGKIGLSFSLLTLAVLVIQFFVDKATRGDFTNWSSKDAMKLLNYINILVTMIVIAVPEGLPLAVTLNLAFATKSLTNDRALVRHLSACETMGSASYLCLDKTGTVTSNCMVVNKLWISGEVVEMKDNRNGNKLKGKISEEVLNILLQALFQNNASEMVKDKQGKTTILGTSTDSALLEFGLLLGGNFDVQCQLYSKLKIESFNPVYKKMTVLVSLPNGGLRVFCKGASEIIIKMCEKIIDCNGESVDFLENHAKHVEHVLKDFASEPLRTISLAYKDINVIPTENNIPDNGYTLIAIVGINDPIRLGVKDVVQTCLAAGVTIAMVTGDDMNIARTIAKECGILTNNGLTIEGQEFRNLSTMHMKVTIPQIQVMARFLPHDKHSIVASLKDMFGEVVAVTGDGISDAPALHEAHIGVAMGLSGTEIAKENADIILMDDNITTIVNIIKWGRAVYINIQKLVQFQLTAIIVALVINFISASVTGYVPLTAVQLLWVNLIMDILCPLALVSEPLNDELMKRPPVGRGEKFITNAMWRNIFGQSIYQVIVLVVLNFEGKNILSISGSNATDVLRTLIFNSFIFFQVFNEINCREIEKINIFKGILNSWAFLVIIFSTVAIQVIIVQFLGNFACTVSLNLELWLISVLIGATSMLIACLLKCFPIERHVSIRRDGYQALSAQP
ncbi:putative calcium-transporting ATPase [Medicago truncatula]|uniref:Calcium-transporting ATPase n=1 Tax=Medicago truncatula TaxID=3880 RepID=A0A396GLQ8_MEDTR|nr:calcium-transporting ATPase 4, plasma membrane-type [Medicago truncatula]RHN40504.1 putative calcium-transporting ATPase [Medicago truncatula]